MIIKNALWKLDHLDFALTQLRAVGRPAPENPDADGHAELDGRKVIADRLDDEVSWRRQAAGRLTVPDTGRYRPGVQPAPGQDWPDTERRRYSGRQGGSTTYPTTSPHYCDKPQHVSGTAIRRTISLASEAKII